VDRERCPVVDPDDRLALVVATGRGIEAACRRRALVGCGTARRAQRGIGNDLVAEGRAEQHDRSTDQSARGLEDVDPGVALVDDGERQALVVIRVDHPGGGEAGGVGSRSTGEIRRRLARKRTRRCGRSPIAAFALRQVV